MTAKGVTDVSTGVFSSRRPLLAFLASAAAFFALAATFALAPTIVHAQRGYLESRPVWARELLDLLNSYRASKGLPLLAWDSRLAAAAQWMAEDMAGQCLAGPSCPLSHIDSQGRRPAQRAASFGYPWAVVGENAAFGYPTPADALEGWKRSPGHEMNQTRSDWTVAGVGVACAVFAWGREACYYYIKFGPVGTPPTMVSLWPCGPGVACISFSGSPHPAEQDYTWGVRLISALDSAMSLARREQDIPRSDLLWGNTIVVGMPDRDGLTYYFDLALCYGWANTYGCSDPVPVGSMAARRFPAGTSEHWSFVMGGYRFLGTATVWIVSDVSVPTKRSDLALYSGLQGFGGIRRHTCLGASPGQICMASWPWPGGFVSGSQSFPPYPEIGTGVLLR